MYLAKLKNVIQDYAWGSFDALPKLLGYENPQKIPQAELWMGTHLRGSSQVDGQDLADYLLAAPHHLAAHQHPSGQLPYLFKILAAKQALSLQVHPNKKQAEEGWQREETEGIAVDAAERNYKDRNHKPEILLALTPFYGMSGFRSLAEIEAGLKALLPELDYQDHRSFFASFMKLARSEKKEQPLNKLENFCATHSNSEAAKWVEKLSRQYPGDLTVLAPFYLNIVSLQAGEASFLKAGVLHAYIEGAGVELMANSDNVVRGGLTSKHCDVPELMKLLEFKEQKPTFITPQSLAPWRKVYPCPVNDFSLECWQLHGGARWECQNNPSIAVLLEGEIKIKCGEELLKLTQGESIFISAQRPTLELEAQKAKLYVATLPEKRTAKI